MGSEAQTKASVKFNRKCGTFAVGPAKETGAKIRRAAETAGVSVTEFILTALKEYIEK